MKIGYFADGPWSHEALKKIELEPDLEIVFITPRFDTQDTFLKKWAYENKVPFMKSNNVNSHEFLDEIKDHQPELLVSMSFNQILKTEIINLAPKGFINCHAGALPFYRGRNPLNWVLINGEENFGITVHYVDEGIDTGDIINQRFYDIEESDNYGSLLERAIVNCAEILVDSILEISLGTSNRKSQSDIHPVGTYFSRRIPGDEIMDFNQSSLNCFNFIRAISVPGPCARTHIKNEQYAILESKLIPDSVNYLSKVAEIVGLVPEGSIVKTGTSTLMLTRMAKINELGELGEVFVPQFKIGTRFSPKVTDNT